MDNFLEELCCVAKLPFDEISKNFKVNMLGNNIVYVTNFIKILDYSEQLIVLKISKNLLNIYGEQLTICQINKKEILIKGKISAIYIGDKNDKK